MVLRARKGLAVEKQQKGQSLTEVALLVAMVAAALTGITLYLQRSMQQRYREGVTYVFDKIKGCVTDPVNVTKQYDPYYHTSYTQENRRSNETTGFPNHTRNSTVNQSGWEYTSVQ